MLKEMVVMEKNFTARGFIRDMNIIEKIEKHPYATMAGVGGLLVSIGVVGMASFWDGLVVMGISLVVIAAATAA